VEKIINEEYKIWKKNSPYLYDLILSTALEWPSLTCQWFVDKENVKDDNMDYSKQRLLLGTNTSDMDANELLICEVRIPAPDTKSLQSKYEESCDVYGGFGGGAGKVDFVQKIVHNGEINRARYMWQNPDIIATKTKFGDVYIFDRSKHPSKPDDMSICKPQAILTGHSKEGYGLHWSPINEGLLLSSSDDCSICLWDVRKIAISKNKTKSTGFGAKATPKNKEKDKNDDDEAQEEPSENYLGTTNVSVKSDKKDR